ncbi:MAG: nuclear transport factor 2 family protein [Steroidobacteraceae bacterium]
MSKFIAPFLVSTALLFGAATAPAFAAQSDADVIREARDRAEIEKLLWDYARALDTGNADAYAATYTADGAFGATKGTEALKKMVNDLNKSRDERKAKGEEVWGTLHMTTNHWIEFTGKDSAKVHNYWLTAFVAPPTAPGAKRPEPRVPFTGRGVDDLVKVNGKWLIKFRNTAPKD